MRLSDLSRSKVIIGNLNRNQELLDRFQNEASTGKRLLSVADDPGQTSKLLQYKDAMSLTEGYLKNIKTARNELNIYESLSNNLVGAARDVKIVVEQAANSPGYNDSYDQFKQRINALLESFVSLGNNSVKGEYMYAGSKVQTQPFQVTRDGTGQIVSVTYQGDNMPKVFSPETSERIEVDLSGDEIFMGPAGMGQDIFQELINIRNDLTPTKFNNSDQHLMTMETIANRLINKEGEIGSITQHLDRLEDFLSNYNYGIQEKASDIEYVDMAETVTQLMNQEFIYKSNLEVAARMNRITLLDYMR